MKTFFSIIVIMLLLSCNTEKEPIQNSQAHYAAILKQKLAENGVKNTKYFEVDYDNFDIGNSSHEEILASIDEIVPIFKKEYEAAAMANSTLKKFTVYDSELRLLLKTVKEHHLEDKEPFYQKLLSLKSFEEQVALFEAEQKEFRAKMDASSHDLRTAADTQEHYAYLEVYARDQNGKLVDLDLINDENRDSTSYTIKKYDPSHIQLLKTVVWE